MAVVLMAGSGQSLAQSVPQDLPEPLKILVDNSMKEDSVESFRIDFNNDGHEDIFYNRGETDGRQTVWYLSLYDGESYNRTLNEYGSSFVFASDDLPHDLVWLQDLQRWGVRITGYDQGGTVGVYSLQYLDENNVGRYADMGRECVTEACTLEPSKQRQDPHPLGGSLSEEFIDTHYMPPTPIKVFMTQAEWDKKPAHADLPRQKWRLDCPYEWREKYSVCRLFDKTSGEFLGYLDSINGYYLEVTFNPDGTIASVKRLGYYLDSDPPVRLPSVPPEVGTPVKGTQDSAKPSSLPPAHAAPADTTKPADPAADASAPSTIPPLVWLIALASGVAAVVAVAVQRRRKGR